MVGKRKRAVSGPPALITDNSPSISPEITPPPPLHKLPRPAPGTSTATSRPVARSPPTAITNSRSRLPSSPAPCGGFPAEPARAVPRAGAQSNPCHRAPDRAVVPGFRPVWPARLAPPARPERPLTRSGGSRGARACGGSPAPGPPALARACPPTRSPRVRQAGQGQPRGEPTLAARGSLTSTARFHGSTRAAGRDAERPKPRFAAEPRNRLVEGLGWTTWSCGGG